MTNQPEPIRFTIREIEKNLSDLSDAEKLNALSTAQALATGNEYAIAVYAIVKRRIIRKAGMA